MGSHIYAVVVILVVVAVFVGYWYVSHLWMKRLPPEKRAQVLAEREKISTYRQYGEINATLICPHCQTKGQVYTKAIDQKKGISGGKATGALLTGGVSMLATGLSRKEHLTQAHCENCTSTWVF